MAWWMALLACGGDDPMFGPMGRSEAFPVSWETPATMEACADVVVEALASEGFVTSKTEIFVAGWEVEAVRGDVTVAVAMRTGGDGPPLVTVELKSTARESSYLDTVDAAKRAFRSLGAEPLPFTKQPRRR